MLIRTMGLFWKRDCVFWGKPNNHGRLLGVAPNALKDQIDFWNQIGVYALYADYHLVYVGQTSKTKLGGRLKNHLKDDLAGRWDSFSWFGALRVLGGGKLSEPPDVKLLKLGDILDHIEGVLIACAEPPLNRQGGRFGKSVTRYLQRRDDDRLGPSGPES